MDELDRILARDEDLRPSAGLTDAVMEAVRRDADTAPPVAFPWRRLAAGLAVCLVLFIAGLALSEGSPAPPDGPSPVAGPDWATLAADPLLRSLGLAVGALFLTWISSRFALRLAGHRR